MYDILLKAFKKTRRIDKFKIFAYGYLYLAK